MTLNQKIDWVKDLLSGQHSLWNRSDFYIPTQDISTDVAGHFWEIIQKFEREGLVKKAYLGYAGLFDADHKPEVFETIGDDGKIPKFSYKDDEDKKTKTVKLIPTYYIEIDKKNWVDDKKLTKEGVESAPKARMIEKERNNFYLDRQKLNFTTDDSIHFRLLDTLYGEDGEGRLLCYEVLDKALVKLGEEQLDDHDKILMRIRNAVHGGLYNRVSKNLAEYVKIRPRKGIELLNPSRS